MKKILLGLLLGKLHIKMGEEFRKKFIVTSDLKGFYSYGVLLYYIERIFIFVSILKIYDLNYEYAFVILFFIVFDAIVRRTEIPDVNKAKNYQ